ncbi:MAG: M20 family metallopeptidase [Lachnospiraceae bacterium]
MQLKSLHESVHKQIMKRKEDLYSISDYIFNHPELGDEEYLSSAYLQKALEAAGFTVTRPYKGIETAFRAELRNGDGPRVAFLAEYDALPGYGPDKKPGHACGHNWIAATCAGAGIILADMKEQFAGTVVVFGTPAEETTGRKVDLAKAGAFDDIDAAFQMHLYQNTNLNSRALAMDAAEFTFIGKASHAAVNPEDGINALDAVMLTFSGINFLRQQLGSDVRIHGVVTEGGEAPNTIPARCKCLFYVRAAKKSYFEKVFEKVKNCARGAALMTGAELVIDYPENTYYDLQLNPILVRQMEQHMKLAGFDALNEEDEEPGSTDLGNVSYSCPVLYANVGIADGKALVHEEAFLDVANSDEAKAKLLKAAQCFVCAALELSASPELVQEVKKSFQEMLEKNGPSI